MNGTWRWPSQPPVAENRCSEAAVNAGIAIKWCAMALMAAQCGYASPCCLHRVHRGNGQTPPSTLSGCVDATCSKFGNQLYVLKIGYQLKTGLPAYQYII